MKNAAKNTVPQYGTLNSYQLTPEQIEQALLILTDALLNDDGDQIASHVLAVLRSFTYTTDTTQREEMLLAADKALMPYIQAVSATLNSISRTAHQSLIGVSTAQ